MYEGEDKDLRRWKEILLALSMKDRQMNQLAVLLECERREGLLGEELFWSSKPGMKLRPSRRA